MSEHRAEIDQPDYARRWDLDALAQPCRDCEVGEPHMCPRTRPGSSGGGS